MKGFTLIELLIVVTVIGILILAFVPPMIEGNPALNCPVDYC